MKLLDARGRELWVRRSASVIALALAAANLVVVAIRVGPDGFFSLVFGVALLFIARFFWPSEEAGK